MSSLHSNVEATSRPPRPTQVRAAEKGYKATIVEVQYEAFMFHTAQITLPDGNVFHLPHDNFQEGMWVTGAVRGFDAERNEYDARAPASSFGVGGSVGRWTRAREARATTDLASTDATRDPR